MNPLMQKRWQRFKSRRRTLWSVYILLAMLLVSLTAEMWANSRPIIMAYKGHIFFPAYKYYHPVEFGYDNQVQPDYRAMRRDKIYDWAVWPLVEWNPIESNTDVQEYPSPPTAINWLGTDDRGRDVLARVLYGFRYSMVFAFLVWFLSFSLGTFVGAWMGFMGGRFDLLGQRGVEIFEAMPKLLLLMTLVSIFGASMTLLVGFSALFGWMMISTYIRAEFLKLRRREFVEAARALGVGAQGQVFKHILPNALGPLITFSPFDLAMSISSLAALDYLGFGLPAPTPSWGELFSQAQVNFTVAWWLAVFPSLALFLSLFVLTLIGEGVRDAFDPRYSM